MIKLRELREADAELMLDWMHDPEVQKGFRKNMLSMTLEDARRFCEKSKIPGEITNGTSIHYAIVDDADDVYLGTVSLKNIDVDNNNAEYAISTRRLIHGKGIASKATRILLSKAFNEYNLNRVYLNVLSDNEMAIRLYEKCGFVLEGEIREQLMINGEYKNLRLYGILKGEHIDG